MQTRPGRVICSVIKDAKPPESFVVVARGWPSCLITLSSLKMRVERAFFPAQFHPLFNQTKLNATGWNLVPEFDPTLFNNAVFLVSDSHKFVDMLLSLRGDFFLNASFIEISVSVRGKAKNSFHWSQRVAMMVLEKH